MACHLYVYYRSQADGAALKAAFAAQQAQLAAWNVQAVLQRRRDDPHTWMEIYRDVPTDSGFAEALREAAGPMTPLLEGARHEEWFVDTD